MIRFVWIMICCSVVVLCVSMFLIVMVLEVLVVVGVEVSSNVFIDVKKIFVVWFVEREVNILVVFFVVNCCMVV